MLRVFQGVESVPKIPDRPGRKQTYGDIFSYIEEKGRFPIGSKYPFNEVDALVLSRVAYLYFEGLVGPDFRSRTKIKDIADTYLSLTKKDAISVLQAEDVHLVKAIKNTRRFGELKLTGYRSYFSEDDVEQFAGVTIILTDKTAFISFRGTDGSLNGWREDFDLGFLGVIPSDRDALKYAKEAMDSLPKVEAFYIGGHSKGGNLAAYTACTLPRRLKVMVKHVYIFDAPGFRKDVYQTLDRDSLAERTSAYAPSQSIIGMILYTIAPYTAVLSRRSLFFQHDTYNWCVDGDRLARGRFQRISYGVKRMSKDFFETMDIRYLEGCIDTLFSAIRSERGAMRNGTMDVNLSRMFSLMMMLRRIPPDHRRTFLSIFSSVTSHMRRIASVERRRVKAEKATL